MRSRLLALFAAASLALGCQETANNPAGAKSPAAKTHIANKPIVGDTQKVSGANSGTSTENEIPAATTQGAKQRKIAKPDETPVDGK